MFRSVFYRGPSSVSTQAARSSSNNQQCLQVNECLYELHRPLGIPTVQVVFFHGLQLGDYSNAHWSTWQSEDASCIWPKTWLVEDIPGAHVLSVLYGQSLRNKSDGAVDLYIMAENLLSDLLQGKIGQESNCPVVLVGHSFGGLVIKKLFCQAYLMWLGSDGSKKVALEAFLNSVTGIFYFSTPHQGSPVAGELARVLGQSPTVKYFKTLNRDSARLSYEFDAIWKSNERSLAGVGETCTTDLGPFQGIVAPEASTRRGVGDFNLVDGADHFSICRPRDKFVRNFLKLKDFVVEATARFRSPAAKNEKLIQTKLPYSVEGLIKGLVHSLSMQDRSAVQVHLATLENLAYYHDPSRVAIANENGRVALLPKLLNEQDHVVMQQAARLMAGKEKDDWISSKILQEEEARPALVTSLSSPGEPGYRHIAPGVLASGSGNQVAKEAITNEPGEIVGFDKLLSKQNGGDRATQAARALKNVTREFIPIESNTWNAEVVIAGLVECLGVPDLQEQAVWALADLAHYYPPSSVAITNEGGALAAVVKVLIEHDSDRAQGAAAIVLWSLASGDEWIKMKITHEVGAVPALVGSLAMHHKPFLQEKAVGALASLAWGNEVTKMAITSEPRAIAYMVQLLSRENNDNTRREAARALGNLGTSNEISIQSKITHEEIGAIACLVECLSVQDKPDLQERAVWALADLAHFYPPNSVAIANEAGALEAVVKVLTEHDSDSAQGAAAIVLWSLASGDEWMKMKITHEDGAIPALVRSLAKHHKPFLQEKAVGALASLAWGNEVTKIAIASEPRAIAYMVTLLSRQKNGNTRKEAARALGNLGTSNEISIQSKIAHEEIGAIACLVECLSVQDMPDLQERAVWALADLAHYYPPNSVAIANEAGALAAVVKVLIEHDSDGAQGAAAIVLWSLASGDEWIKMKITHEDGAKPALVGSLGIHDKPFLQEKAAGALGSLASGSEVTKEAITSEPRAIADMVKLLSRQKNGNTRIAAAMALKNLASSKDFSIQSKIGNEEGAIASLLECLRSVEDERLQKYAREALKNLAGTTKVS